MLDAVTLYFTAATNFVNYKKVNADQHQCVEDYLHHISGKNFTVIYDAAIADYKNYFDTELL